MSVLYNFFCLSNRLCFTFCYKSYFEPFTIYSQCIYHIDKVKVIKVKSCHWIEETRLRHTFGLPWDYPLNIILLVSIGCYARRESIIVYKCQQVAIIFFVYHPRQRQSLGCFFVFFIILLCLNYHGSNDDKKWRIKLSNIIIVPSSGVHHINSS